MTIKLNTHMVLQAAAAIVSLTAVLAPQVPLKYKPVVVGIGAGAQWLMGYIAHNSTPDGTKIPPA